MNMVILKTLILSALFNLMIKLLKKIPLMKFVQSATKIILMLSPIVDIFSVKIALLSYMKKAQTLAPCVDILSLNITKSYIHELIS